MRLSNTPTYQLVKIKPSCQGLIVISSCFALHEEKNGGIDKVPPFFAASFFFALWHISFPNREAEQSGHYRLLKYIGSFYGFRFTVCAVAFRRRGIADIYKYFRIVNYYEFPRLKIAGIV